MGLTQEQDRHNDSQVASNQSETITGTPNTTNRIPFSYTIGIYSTFSITMCEIYRALGVHHDEYFPFQYIMPLSVNGIVTKAAETHASACQKDPKLHKTMFLVADEPDLEKHGIIFVAVIEGRKHPRARRQPVEFRSTYLRFDGFQSGREVLRHTHWTYLAYGGEGLSASKVARSLSKSMNHSDAIVAASSEDSSSKETPAPPNLKQTIKTHPVVCYDKRFLPNLSRQCFVYSEPDMLAKDECMIVRVKWNWDIWQQSLEAVQKLDLNNEAEVLRCSIADVQGILTAVEEASTQGIWHVRIPDPDEELG